MYTRIRFKVEGTRALLDELAEKGTLSISEAEAQAPNVQELLTLGFAEYDPEQGKLVLLAHAGEMARG